jgi:hypothetical protein
LEGDVRWMKRYDYEDGDVVWEEGTMVFKKPFKGASVVLVVVDGTKTGNTYWDNVQEIVDASFKIGRSSAIRILCINKQVNVIVST